MKYNPLVTIIIPVYNGSNFLKEAIDSALSQTYNNIEIIVINDGSNDNGETDKIAKSYGEKIRYYLKKNGGVSSALNFALKKMNGEWFSWLSHDDLYYPEKIEKEIELINLLLIRNPNIDINKITIRCATESIDKNGKIIKVPNYKDIPLHEDIIDTILNNLYNYRLSGCAFLLPSSCIKDIGFFDENIRTVSDVEYWYRLLFSGYNFYCLSNDILVKNRSHGKQVGKTKVELFNKEREKLFISISNKLNNNSEYNTKKNNEKLYYAFIKNKCPKASNYVLHIFLQNMANKMDFYMKYPLMKIWFSILGNIRNFLRYLYRRIRVK